MTFATLHEILKRNSIPENVTLMSDSGWECYATDMDGTYYNPATNTIVFTQEISEYDHYYNNPDWKPLQKGVTHDASKGDE